MDPIDQQDEYVPLSVDLFFSGRHVPVDIYIRISEGKFVRLAGSGEDLTQERLRAYKQREVESLYIRKIDFAKYVGFGIQIAAKLPLIGTIEKEKKIVLLSQVARLMTQGIYLQGVDQEGFQGARDFVQSTVSVLTDNADALKLLSALSEESNYLLGHALAVAIYGLMLARQLSWSSPSMLLKIALGGLLHDVGLKEVSPSITGRSRIDRNADETKSYESHATRGAELLSRINGIPSEIIQITLQHHENCQGHGYPSGIKRDRIHPLARLISVVDQFVYFALKNPESEGLSPHAAIDRLMTYQANVVEPTYLVSLMRMLNYPVPEKMRLLYDREAGTGTRTGNAA
jgi:putative nucleotidyltransferase with HDIG domain